MSGQKTTPYMNVRQEEAFVMKRKSRFVGDYVTISILDEEKKDRQP